MNKIKLYASILFLAMVGLLYLSRPSQEAFLEQVAIDYGQTHHGLAFDASRLAELGEASTKFYFLFDVHTYQFGSISVSYIGLLGSFYKVGSGYTTTKPQERTA